MSTIAMCVENLGKLYKIGQRERYLTLRDVLTDRFRRAFSHALNHSRSTVKNDDYIWALRGVAFEIREGEVVGFIGRNGAGKSTLLKILSRITEPTEGHAEIRGRVGSLLEIGTGFHSELTGRENIYFNGAILGMKKREIERKFDQIVEFSEIGKFIDTPVKRYSTGMQLRLAFAIAAYLEQEILLVDEVLAVGDAAFQKKCLGKMSEVASEGRTVLFVSHNMAAVQDLCDRVIWLSDGRIVQDGTPSTVISDYLKTSSSTLTDRVWDDMATAPGNDRIRLHRASVRGENGSTLDQISVRTPIVIELEYWNLMPESNLELSLNVFNEQGVHVLRTMPIHEPTWHGRPLPPGLFRSRCFIPGDLLNDGAHRITLTFHGKQGTVIYTCHDILVFSVLDAREGWLGSWPGAVRPNLRWSTELISIQQTSSSGD